MARGTESIAAVAFSLYVVAGQYLKCGRCLGTGIAYNYTYVHTSAIETFSKRRFIHIYSAAVVLLGPREYSTSLWTVHGTSTYREHRWDQLRVLCIGRCPLYSIKFHCTVFPIISLARTKVCFTDIVVFCLGTCIVLPVADRCGQVKKRAFFVDLPDEAITEEALKAAGEC